MQYTSGWASPWTAPWALGLHETNLSAVNDAGETAIIIAAKKSNQTCISMLCDVYNYRHHSDACYECDTDLRRNVVHILNMGDTIGRTALSYSCSCTYETINIVRQLLDAVSMLPMPHFLCYSSINVNCATRVPIQI